MEKNRIFKLADVDEQQERKYKCARKRVNQTIENNASNVLKDVKLIINYRCAIQRELIKKWIQFYAGKIKGFDEIIDSNINKALTQSYTNYVRYVFSYRFLNNLPDNILFRKIISFEIFFFIESQLLETKLGKEKKPKNKIETNQQLFDISPLAHFIYYRISTEYAIEPKNLAEQEEKEDLFRKTTSQIRESIGEFFLSFDDIKNDIQLKSFWNYIEKSSSQSFREIIERIELRDKEDI